MIRIKTIPRAHGILNFLFNLFSTGSKTRETKTAIVSGIKTDEVTFRIAAATIAHKNNNNKKIGRAKFVYFFII